MWRCSAAASERGSLRSAALRAATGTEARATPPPRVSTFARSKQGGEGTGGVCREQPPPVPAGGKGGS